MFAFAGIWDRWNGKDGIPVESCAIITTSANEVVAPFHDRMPVILPEALYSDWLNPELKDVDRLTGMLTPFPASQMKDEVVSSVINNARNEVDPREK